ncbi:MAG: Ig-like domain-containing protein [Patescibacteria group bacterium]
METKTNSQFSPAASLHPRTRRFGLLAFVLPASLLIYGLAMATQLQAGNGIALFPSLKKSVPPSVYTCTTLGWPASLNAAAQAGDRASLDSGIAEQTQSLRSATNPSVNQVALRTNLSDRKESQRRLLFTDAEAVMNSLLTPQMASAYRTWTKNCVEEKIRVEGTLEQYIADPVDGAAQGIEVWTVKTPAGKSYTLHPVGEQHAALLVGSEVAVDGYRIDEHIFFNAENGLVENAAEPATGYNVLLAREAQDFVLGPQETIVLLANFQNTSQPSLSQSTVSYRVFTDMNGYYQNNSYGNISVVGEVRNWKTVPINQSCDMNAMLNAALVAFDADVDFSQYERVIVISPFGPSCSWGGISTVGKTSITTDDGVVAASASFAVANYAGTTLLAHEYGHGLGLHHASFYNCPGVPFQESGCDLTEYGDPFSIMGANLNFGYFNALEKNYLGWFTPSNILTVTQNGTYTIDHLEVASLNLKALKIQRAEDDYLYVEFRQPIGHDINFGFTNGYDGALVHFHGFQDFTGPLANRSFLLDAAHGAGWGNVNDSALTPGQTFVDPLTQTAVTTVEKGDGTLDVQVTLGKTDFTSPAVAITAPENNATVGGVFTVEVDATDASGISRVELHSLQTLKSAIATDTTFPYSFQLDSRNYPVGPNGFFAIAYDNAGNPYGVTDNKGTSAFTTFIMSEGDTTPPEVTMITPVDGGAAHNPVSFLAHASDNGSLTTTLLYVDGVSKFMLFGGTTVDIGGPLTLTTGLHTAYAKSTDTSSLTTTTPIVTFLVDDTVPQVVLTAPAEGAQLSGFVDLTADASDNDAIQKVAFVMDSSVVLNEDSTAPYAFALDSSTVSAGAHTIQAKAYDRAGNVTTSVSHGVTIFHSATFVCGDVDGNAIVTISDIVSLINYIFNGTFISDPLAASDVDGNGLVTISDAVYLIQFIFSGGPAPACPASGTSVEKGANATEGMTIEEFRAAHSEVFGS